jgi:hypothetical protein
MSSQMDDVLLSPDGKHVVDYAGRHVQCTSTQFAAAQARRQAELERAEAKRKAIEQAIGDLYDVMDSVGSDKQQPPNGANDGAEQKGSRNATKSASARAAFVDVAMSRAHARDKTELPERAKPSASTMWFKHTGDVRCPWSSDAPRPDVLVFALAPNTTPSASTTNDGTVVVDTACIFKAKGITVSPMHQRAVPSACDPMMGACKKTNVDLVGRIVATQEKGTADWTLNASMQPRTTQFHPSYTWAAGLRAPEAVAESDDE